MFFIYQPVCVVAILVSFLNKAFEVAIVEENILI